MNLIQYIASYGDLHGPAEASVAPGALRRRTQVQATGLLRRPCLESDPSLRFYDSHNLGERLRAWCDGRAEEAACCSAGWSTPFLLPGDGLVKAQHDPMSGPWLKREA